MKSNLRWKFIAAVMGYALLCRVLPYVLHALNEAGVPIDPRNSWYPWNFSPVIAACAFAGAVVPQRKRTMFLIAALMIGGDVLIDLLTGYRYWTVRNQFVQLWVYACMGLIAVLGRQIQRRPSLIAGLPVALVGEVFYFVITNFAVWLSAPLPGTEAPMYPFTWQGLVACYVAALPFWSRGLIGTAIYAGLFFSPWGLGLAGVEPSRNETSPEPALEAVRS